tara:strand:- start:994 stop:1518 length:525 start_codon:yes stop_codon:yes gene_type:complete
MNPKAASEALAKNVCSAVKGRSPGVVSSYLPIGDEINPERAMCLLVSRGWRQVLPVVVSRTEPLIFRAWLDGDALDNGPMRTRHPSVSAEELQPEVLLVPMLSFDLRGQRMGWGGGFYDRTIAELRGKVSLLAIGVAFEAQRVCEVPNGKFDAPLDAIATDVGLHWVEKKLCAS